VKLPGAPRSLKPKDFLGNYVFSGCSKTFRCKAPEILRVASRRTRSDSCHADE
jgi:hypothetical protein